MNIMPAKNRKDLKRALASFASLLVDNDDGEEEEDGPRPKPKNTKGKGKGKGGGRGTKPQSSTPSAPLGPHDPGYDEELHGSSWGAGGLVAENPCFICTVLGHRGRAHDLPPAWPQRLR